MYYRLSIDYSPVWCWFEVVDRSMTEADYSGHRLQKHESILTNKIVWDTEPQCIRKIFQQTNAIWFYSLLWCICNNWWHNVKKSHGTVNVSRVVPDEVQPSLPNIPPGLHTIVLYQSPFGSNFKAKLMLPNLSFRFSTCHMPILHRLTIHTTHSSRYTERRKTDSNSG